MKPSAFKDWINFISNEFGSNENINSSQIILFYCLRNTDNLLLNFCNEVRLFRFIQYIDVVPCYGENIAIRGFSGLVYIN